MEPINVEENIVKGNLTIKGITHLVTFPAKIETKNGIIKMSGKLVIDRTKWDVKFDFTIKCNNLQILQ